MISEWATSVGLRGDNAAVPSFRNGKRRSDCFVVVAEKSRDSPRFPAGKFARRRSKIIELGISTS